MIPFDTYNLLCRDELERERRAAESGPSVDELQTSKTPDQLSSDPLSPPRSTA